MRKVLSKDLVNKALVNEGLFGFGGNKKKEEAWEEAIQEVFGDHSIGVIFNAALYFTDTIWAIYETFMDDSANAAIFKTLRRAIDSVKGDPTRAFKDLIKVAKELNVGTSREDDMEDFLNNLSALRRYKTDDYQNAGFDAAENILKKLPAKVQELVNTLKSKNSMVL